MPTSTDVNLPRKHTAKFPTRCVRCNADPDGGSLKIWTHSIGWWTTVFWMFGSSMSVRVPACRGCGWRIRIQRTGSTIAIMVFAFLFLFLVWPHLDDFIPRAFRRWAAMGAILLCLSPWFFWEVFFPPSIDITAYSESVDYEFRDSSYAHEFAELNAGADWMKIE